VQAATDSLVAAASGSCASRGGANSSKQPAVDLSDAKPGATHGATATAPQRLLAAAPTPTPSTDTTAVQPMGAHGPAKTPPNEFPDHETAASRSPISAQHGVPRTHTLSPSSSPDEGDGTNGDSAADGERTPVLARPRSGSQAGSAPREFSSGR